MLRLYELAMLVTAWFGEPSPYSQKYWVAPLRAIPLSVVLRPEWMGWGTAGLAGTHGTVTAMTSHALPMPLALVSVWSGLLTLGQLSPAVQMPSPSGSWFAALPSHASPTPLLFQSDWVGLPLLTQLSQELPNPSWSVSAWLALAVI